MALLFLDAHNAMKWFTNEAIAAYDNMRAFSSRKMFI